MLQRIFIGYTTPFLNGVTDYLLKESDELSDVLIIVPTTQSGRVLRENLAATAGAILAPSVTTPGALLHLEDPDIAPKWLEKIAWIEVIESISGPDWNSYSALFPKPPITADRSGDWAHSLATEIVSLRTILEESLHDLFTASKFLMDTPEGERWENLAKLENLMEKKLHAWGYRSRSRALRSDFHLPSQFQKIILAGVTEMPACLAKALSSFSGHLTVLIAAPDSEKEHVSDLGIPLETWTQRDLPESAKVSVCADPASQAEAAFMAIASAGLEAHEIALGSADDETGTALARLFSKNGWPAFHPASRAPLSPLLRWLQSWIRWLTQPSSRHLAALLSLPESAHFIAGNRSSILIELNQYRDHHPAIEPKDILQQRVNRTSRQALRTSIETLLSSRDAFLSHPFPGAMKEHIAALKIDSDASIATLDSIRNFIDTANPLLNSLKRGNLFWLQILLSELSAPASQPPSDRVIDVQGWLELLYEPGAHLIICGMNETFVPTRPGGEPWLSDTIREKLGITSISHRHARDAFLLHAMIRMRESTGSTHLFCGKNGGNQQVLLPSRMLLQVPLKALPPTVETLFPEIDPPEAGLIWERDIIWTTPEAAAPEKLYVTSLRDYLSCPFRFYLKHVLRATQPDPDRREMNHRDFGSLAHKVLEDWGQDPDARNLTDSKKLSDDLTRKLQNLAELMFGHEPSVAIRIQLLAIQQRLQWFAEIQAQNCRDGWDVLHVERKIHLVSNGLGISGKVDRVDRHRETGELRVIDYKTGKVTSTESEHRKKIIASTQIPKHISEGAPPIHPVFDGNKHADYLWKNLQLPLYALAEKPETDAQAPIPCYIQLGANRKDVQFMPWENFSQTDLDAAKACLDWITSSITQKIFWPPSEAVKYDDYALLSQQTPLENAFSSP